MRACIIRIGSRPILDKRSIVSLELWYLRKWIEENGFYDEVVIHTPQIREAVDIEWAQDLNSLSKFSTVYVHSSTPNFFGGKVGPETVKIAEMLAEYRGAIVYVVNDPSIAPINFPGIIWKRDLVPDYMDFCKLAQLMDDSRTRSSIMFSGSTLSWRSWIEKQSWCIGMPRVRHEFSGFFRYIAQNHLHIQDILDPSTCEFDVVYYGARRGGHRQKKIKDYLPKVSSLLVGHASDACSVNVRSSVPHATLTLHARRAAGSLILGDEIHEKGWQTMRLFEAPYWGLVSFVDEAYGTPYEGDAARLTTVKDGEDLAKKIEFINEYNLWGNIAAAQRAHWGIKDEHYALSGTGS